MRKNLIILLLCAPLLWITGVEGTRLYRVFRWSSPALDPADDEPRPKKEVLDKARKTADAIVDLPDDVTGAVVRLEPPPPGAPTDSHLSTTVLKHAKKRAERAIEVDAAKDEGQKVEKTVRQILKSMRGPEGWPSVPDKERELDAALEEYVTKVHDPELVASARAQAAWVTREENFSRAKLEQQFNSISQSTPETAGKGANFDDFVATYRRYLNDHGLAKEAEAARLTGEAKTRLDLAQRGAALLTILKNLAAPATDSGEDQSKRRIDAIAAIAKLNEDNPGESVRRALRQVVQSLCNEYLKRELLDEYVSLTTATSPEPERVKRSDIKVNLKSSEEPVDLGTDGEYKIKPEDVASITIVSKMVERQPPDGGVPPLKGTEYSEAIRAFNSVREGVRQWSDQELSKLLDVCTKNEAKLKQGGGAGRGGQTLIDRIKKLSEIVRSHPGVFAANVP